MLLRRVGTKQAQPTNPHALRVRWATAAAAGMCYKMLRSIRLGKVK